MSVTNGGTFAHARRTAISFGGTKMTNGTQFGTRPTTSLPLSNCASALTLASMKPSRLPNASMPRAEEVVRTLERARAGELRPPVNCVAQPSSGSAISPSHLSSNPKDLLQAPAVHRGFSFVRFSLLFFQGITIFPPASTECASHGEATNPEAAVKRYPRHRTAIEGFRKGSSGVARLASARR